MTGRTIPAHLAHLPVVGGLPVPDVAVWSAEKNPNLVDLTVTRDRIIGHKGTVTLYGMTWLNTGNGRQGRGTPDFGATSSFRQRRSVLTPRCQVCGWKIKGTPWWIIPQPNGWLENLGPGWTKQPPVCGPCAETAPQWCPHLRHAPYDLLQQDAVVVAAWGDVIEYGSQQVRSGVVDLDDPNRTRVLGRELIVALRRP